ncbi:hypothetical protein NQK81_02410 [Amycolatopsis roodepoortensis]|uniref:hypothetical protein n=1 Tax=Amycolatopsis roodepoortensis TaxID=700274 RepID=UPI00214C8615|nr:hypothetical protein [Amycolatopsis roodepoortensis]UUV32327.1 hypothetical protein NQK81_02410 [Amycolatopsis roodepoortensis]
MTQRWIYHHSSTGPATAVDQHMNEMAVAGWELVSANAVVDRGLLRHNFYWRKPA